MHFFPYFSPPNVICFPSFILMQFFSLLNMIPFPLVKWNENVHENDFQERLTHIFWKALILGMSFKNRYGLVRFDLSNGHFPPAVKTNLIWIQNIWIHGERFLFCKKFNKCRFVVVVLIASLGCHKMKLIDLSVHNMAWFVFNQIYFMSKQIWYESHIWCVL